MAESFWDKAILRTKKHALRQAIVAARTHNVDFKTAHADEARDLTREPPNITKAKLRIEEEIDKKIKINTEREKKRGKRRG